MTQAAVKTFVDGEVLTAADLNVLNTNILNNGIAVVSPLTGSLDAGVNNLTSFNHVDFSDAAEAPDTTGYLQRNNLVLQYFDGVRVQSPRAHVTSDMTQVATASTSAYEFLGVCDFSPSGLLDRSDWLLEYVVHILVAANANFKYAKLDIEDGSTTATINLFTTQLGGASITSGTAHVWIWNAGAGLQNYMAVSLMRGECTVRSGTLGLNDAFDPENVWSFLFQGYTPTAAGDLTHTGSRLMLTR